MPQSRRSNSLHIIEGVTQHVRNMRGAYRQITRFIMRRITTMTDEIMHRFRHRAGKQTRVLVQLHLRDQPATPFRVERHHAHHVPQITLQAAVLFGIMTDEFNHHHFVDVCITRRFSPVAFLQKGLLPVDESASFHA